MKKHNSILVVLISAVVFTALFYNKSIGLNLFVYEIILILWFLFAKQISFRNRNEIIYGIGLIITSLSIIFTHSLYSIVVNFIALFILIGVVNYPQAKSLVSTLGISFANTIQSQVVFFQKFGKINVRGRSIGKYLGRAYFILIPLLIIAVFIIIYRYSNPVFEELLVKIGNSISQAFSFVFKDLDLILVLTFLLGLILSNFFILRPKNQEVIDYDQSTGDELVKERYKSKRVFKTSPFKTEYRMGVFLLVTLNAILLIFNTIDIDSVWINFSWKGEVLKQFVHNGTYLLIVSILISIGIVLYFFRYNINFYSKNRLLKYLSYFWLLQNGVLTISVAIRNVYYINYFSLAYRRIGLAIFLLLTIYGLYSVFIKVKNRRSAFYLFRTNLLALYIALVVSSVVNWDSFIAKYNFSHSDKSYLHLDYLATLTDKALPYLDYPLSALMEIDTIQKEKFPFITTTMPPSDYYSVIENRKQEFIDDWEEKSILSWNLPEYLAYKKIKK